MFSVARAMTGATSMNKDAIMVTRKKDGSDTVGARIRAMRDRQGITQDTLAKFVGLKRAAVAQWERNDSKPAIGTMEDVARALGCTPDFLSYGTTTEPKIVAPDPDTLGYALIDEIRFGNSFEEQLSSQQWGLPTNWLRSDMGMSNYKAVIIYKVEVSFRDTKFELGDRLIIDTATRRPSPPGTFLYWDGVGPSIADISVVPQMGAKKAVAKVVTPHGSFETDVDKLQIIGRIKGKLSKL